MGHRHPNLPVAGYLAQEKFHHINVDFPGVQLIHEDPFIFLIHDFVSADECSALIAQVGPPACYIVVYDI